MAAQRQPGPESPPPERPPLRLLPLTPDPAEGALPDPAVARAAFSNGLRWGIVVSSLGFWLPVATALYVWLS